MIRFIKRIVYCFASLLTFLLLMYLVAFCVGEPELNKDRYIKLYDDQNEIFYQSINNYSGQYVSLENVSPYFLKAIVSIEDKRFYQHHGFDYVGISRAIKTNVIKRKNSQGASTITQQYARLLYLTNEKTWSRKVKEAFFTLQLETHLSKDKILEGYINNVYFGHGIYGIENAAQYFYKKKASELTLNEASMLAGVVNGPQYYSPLLHEKKAKQRQALVLNAMYENHVITKSVLEATKKQTLNLAKEHSLNENMSTYYYKDTVLQELEDLGYYNNQYLNKGLNIYTSFDQEYQDTLNQLIKEKDIQTDLQCAFTVVNPKTSQLQALLGGKDYSKSQYNRALHANRQIGSTMKPLLYYLALENGFNPTTSFLCEPTTFKLENQTTYSPSNFHQKYAYKDITLAQAIAVSDNIFAVKTHLFLGTENLYNFLRNYHIKAKNNASLALGTVNTNIYNLSNIYCNIASTGKYQPIYTIEKITDHQGKLIYQHKNKRTQTLNKESCLILSQLLTGTFNKQFSTYLSATMSNYQTKYTVACKTGSTDYDNLIVAYNPNILITGWVGYDDNRKMEQSEEKTITKDVAISFLNKHIKKESWYYPTSKLNAISINPLSGEFDENGIVYWFRKGTP